jgi:hypothetical protein
MASRHMSRLRHREFAMIAMATKAVVIPAFKSKTRRFFKSISTCCPTERR